MQLPLGIRSLPRRQHHGIKRNDTPVGNTSSSSGSGPLCAAHLNGVASCLSCLPSSNPPAIGFQTKPTDVVHPVPY